MLKFGVLGPVTAHRAGLPTDLRTAMLRRLAAILLCRPGQPLPMDNLLDAMWEGEPPASARKTLQVYVHRLRRALGDDRVPRGPTGYALTVQPRELDALLFAELTEQAAKVASQGDPAGASELLGKALGLWRGDAFADITCCGYVSRHAQLLEEQRLHALDQFASLELSLGRHSQLIGILTVACAANPYLETLRGHLMLALYRNGRQADALAEYRQLHQQMVDDLGVEPGSELQQLHEGILQSDPVLRPAASPVVATSGTVRPAQLPLDIRFFTGRTAQLKELDSILPEAGTTVVTITGTAGVGKTTTAVHWAHQVADRFPDGQLYVNLRGFDPSATVTPSAEALRGFLTALGIAVERIPTELEARTAMFRSLLSDKRMLVVLDNARDAEHARPLLPGAGGCLAIVTSRNPLSGLVVAEGAHPVPLDLLTEEESWQLLVGRLGGRVEADPVAANEMIAWCARLPLALMVFAAAALLRPKITLTALVSEFDSDLDALSGDDPLTDVRAVFSWSYRTLSPEAARLFRFLAIHPGPDVGVATAADLCAFAVDYATLALAELVQADLISEGVPGRFGMHDLLRAYATELVSSLDSETDRTEARSRMLDHYLHAAHAAAQALSRHRLPIPMPAAPSNLTRTEFQTSEAAQLWLTTEFPALCEIVTIAAECGFDDHSWKLGWALSDFTVRQSRWSALVEISSATLAAAQRLGDPRGEGYAYRYLAVAAGFNGQYLDCDRLSLAAIDTFTRAELVPEQAMVFIDMAAFFESEPERALGYSKQALVRYQRAGHRAGVAVALNSIGMYHVNVGEYDTSISYAEQALATQLDLADFYSAAASWSTIGLAQYHLGRFAQAVQCYSESISLYRRVGRRLYVADNLASLGDIYFAADRMDEARAAWAEAQEIYDGLGIVKEDLARRLAEIEKLTPAG